MAASGGHSLPCGSRRMRTETSRPSASKSSPSNSRELMPRWVKTSEISFKNDATSKGTFEISGRPIVDHDTRPRQPL
jgi:hypothetical protein